MSEEPPKLYTELAGWWQLVSPTKDYADEAAFFAELFRDANASTLLELGSGGNVAWFLKREFALTLTDISGAMLAESKKQNPELEHIRGDMRTLRLPGRTFDGVLIHDAIMYMISEQDLRAALVTAYEHCKPGGVVSGIWSGSGTPTQATPGSTTSSSWP